MSLFYIQNRNTGFFWDILGRKWKKSWHTVSANGFTSEKLANEYIDQEMKNSTADIRVVDNTKYDLTANDPQHSGEFFAVDQETGKVLNSFPSKELFEEWRKSLPENSWTAIQLTKERP